MSAASTTNPGYLKTKKMGEGSSSILLPLQMEAYGMVIFTHLSNLHSNKKGKCVCGGGEREKKGKKRSNPCKGH